MRYEPTTSPNTYVRLPHSIGVFSDARSDAIAREVAGAGAAIGIGSVHHGRAGARGGAVTRLAGSAGGRNAAHAVDAVAARARAWPSAGLAVRQSAVAAAVAEIGRASCRERVAHAVRPLCS